MKDWQRTLIPKTTSIRAALPVIDAMRIALVVDAEHQLLGTITDGDVRRGLLRQVSLEDTVDRIMNVSPFVASASIPRSEIRSMPEAVTYRFIPVLDKAGRVTGLEGFVTSLSPQSQPNLVVLMAGGVGKRLRPLTADMPKPMLQIGSRPLLETILLQTIAQGFSNFLISVNYRADIVEAHFGDGKRWQVEIGYLKEDHEMGTAGALALLPTRPAEPLVVMNGDLLTKVDLVHLLDYHQEHRAAATMCVREYEFQIPFGVVNVEDNAIRSIEEKPVQRCFINAGIYVLNPEVLDLAAQKGRLDMPALFQEIIARKMTTAVFPIREYWMDIGRMDDFARANSEFGDIFG